MLLSWVWLAALASCGSSTVDGPVDYRTTGGLSGSGDGTALHVELDGTATRPKAGGGTETTMLDAVTLDDLHQKIVNAELPTLAPMYTCPCADDIIYNVSAQLGGTVYTVAANSLATYPAPLKVVIDTLRDIEQRPLDWR